MKAVLSCRVPSITLPWIFTEETCFSSTLDKKSEIVQKEIIEINEKVIEIQNEDPICRPKEFKNLKLIEL